MATAVKRLQNIDQLIESIGFETGIWQIDFYTPTGKWKYSDYVQMSKPDNWVNFDILINTALRETPQAIRQTTIKELGTYWTAVMVNNPLGFPIMVMGRTTND